MAEIRRVVDEYEGVVPDAVAAAAPAPSDPAAAMRRDAARQQREINAVFRSARDSVVRPRADGAPSRGPRPR